MKKYLLALIFTVMSNFSQAEVNINDVKAEDITYEWLVETGNTTSYTDHIPHFREIFKHVKVRTFLEFGCGFSTKYFLDNSRKVISVEFVTNGAGPEWIKHCLGLYRNFSNWTPLVYFSGYPYNTDWAPYKYLGSEHMYKAVSYQTATHQNYALIDDFYLTEINAFIKGLVKYNKIDVAFVDPGAYIRGDLVQLLFGKVSVIAAHDTSVRIREIPGDVYGYSRVVTPDNYEEIPIAYGMGFTVWVEKIEKNQKLIHELKNYAQQFKF